MPYIYQKNNVFCLFQIFNAIMFDLIIDVKKIPQFNSSLFYNIQIFKENKS